MAYPISTQALTLADYAMQSNDPAIQKITMSILQGPSILDDLPLTTNPILKARFAQIRAKDLPVTGWGRINKLPAEIRTTAETVEEAAALVREKIQIDRRLFVQPDWIDDPIQTQIDGAMAAHVYDMNYAFFFNDPTNTTTTGGETNNPDAWTGLRVRLLNPATYNVALNPDGVTTPLLVNAAVDLRKSGTSLIPANADSFIESIRQALAYLGSPDGTGCVAYMNWLMSARWDSAIRVLGAGGGFDMSRDAYDRRVKMFENLKIKEMGFRRDEITPVITYQEDANGNYTGVNGWTSIYIVHYGPGHFNGWQSEELKPVNLGLSRENGTYYNIVVDWACGFKYVHTRSFCQIYGIQLF